MALHSLLLHHVEGGQRFPQAPQLWSSFVVSIQAFGHSVRPIDSQLAHVPRLQISFGPQRFPHALQLLTSRSTFTQLPAQFV